MERVVQALAEKQAEYNDVHVISSMYGSAGRPQREVLNNVNIVRVKSNRLRYPDLTVPRTLPVELLKSADIVHVHAHNSFFSRKILSESAKLKVKTVCYFMAVNGFDSHPNKIIRLFASYYGNRNTKKALSLSNLNLVKSLWDFETLKSKYLTNSVYLPDGISDSFFSAIKQDPADFRKRFNIKQPHFFLFIGRVHKLKGLHILINSLKYANNDIAVVFLGPDGGYLKETLNIATRLGVRDRTYQLGYVNEETKIQAIDSSMALVNPSIADYVEVYPGVISEAWAREKPVIASKVGGNPYRIKNGDNGLLVSPSDPKMLADAMTTLLTNKELREQMGKRGKLSVSSWTAISERCLELYNNILESKRESF
jgi:glycosyltransferase involved in cell wall biosynthesis